MSSRKSSNYSNFTLGVVDYDTVVHLGVEVDEDSVAKHVGLQLNAWQKGVALSCCWTHLTLKLSFQTLDTVVRGECVAFPELHERVFLIQVVRCV